MIEICAKNECTGCSACENICPRSAIKMTQASYLGHLFPEINDDLCIECSLCVKICPIHKSSDFAVPMQTYAAVCSDENLRMNCASGGIATTMCDEFIRNGGIVYGCFQQDYKNIRHVRIDSLADVSRLSGSKYVQSYIGNTYKNIKADLINNKKVLFIGTACQIDGLKKFLLNLNIEHLYCVDVLCHGVASQLMLQNYVKDEILKGRSDLNVHISFRKKTAAGIKYGFFVTDGEGVELYSKYHPADAFIGSFLGHYSLRESCHTCRYAGYKRVSDITLADFWGLRSNTFDKTKGVSLVLLNTEKGAALFNLIKEYVVSEQHLLSEAIRGNGQLQKPRSRPNNKEYFNKLYIRCGLRKSYYLVCRKYILSIYIKKLQQTIKEILLSKFPSIIKLKHRL